MRLIDGYLRMLRQRGHFAHARNYIKVRDEVDSAERKRLGINRLRAAYSRRRGRRW